MRETVLKGRQKRFADALINSEEISEKEKIAAAEKAAGYREGYGKKLLEKVNVLDYIRQRKTEEGEVSIERADSEESEEHLKEKEKDEIGIAQSEDVARFFSEIMYAKTSSGTHPELKDQMKAAEYLAKYHGMFSKGNKADAEDVTRVIFEGEGEIEP